MIRSANRYDMELFDWASERLINQIVQGGDALNRKLRRFKAGNRWFQRALSLLPVYKPAN